VTILLGLVLLITAVCLAIFGVQGIGLPTGQPFLFGIEVGVAGMLGLRLVRGDLGRRLASRRLRRLRGRSVREIGEVVRDRDRLVLELRELRDRTSSRGE
jgi:hypothetical protein